VVPQGLMVFLPFFLFGDFRAFSWNFHEEVLGRFFEGFLLDVTYEDLVPLCLVILIQQTLRNGFDLGVFYGFNGMVFFMVDFRFLLIELGTELLAKGSPRGTPTIPQSLTLIRVTNQEIDRLKF
jgi:hypothetical protein